MKIYKDINEAKVALKELNEKINALLGQYDANMTCEDSCCGFGPEISYYGEDGKIRKLFDY